VALIGLGAVGVAALTMDFRLRIAVALVTALVLAISRRGGWLEHWPGGRVTAYFGKISYSVFLVHFPVCLVVNALVFHFAPGQPVLNALGMLLAWVASNVAGAVFHRYVEAASPLRAVIDFVKEGIHTRKWTRGEKPQPERPPQTSSNQCWCGRTSMYRLRHAFRTRPVRAECHSR
jgi:peptidoglycan/LPS O-acetylase OafA/YrhL